VPLSGHLGDRLRGSVVQFALGRGAARAGFPAAEITSFAIWSAGAGSPALAARAARYAASA